MFVYANKEAEELLKAKKFGDDIKRSFNQSDKIVKDKLAEKDELIKQRDLIIAKLSAKTKEFRKLHDTLYPSLSASPIVIVNKGVVDSERLAIAAAANKGLEDSLYDIHSPCERLFKNKEFERENLKNLKDKFAIEQDTMDMMPLEQRLNYDDHMIKHWTDVVKELEEDISSIYAK